jgi:hypothetical protein
MNAQTPGQPTNRAVKKRHTGTTVTLLLSEHKHGMNLTLKSLFRASLKM